MAAESRQDRQVRIYGAGKLARLQRCKVIVLGTGLLGGAFAFHMGMARIGQLLIDPDTVDQANLANQDFPDDSVGKAKVVVRAEQLHARSTGTAVSWLQAPLEEIGLGIYARHDLIVTGLDSRISRVRVAEISQKLRVPWLDMACDGSGKTLRGTISYWDPRVAGAPCHLCRYGKEEVETIRREGRGPGCPSWSKPEARITQPTLMSATFGGVLAGYGAGWAIDSLLGEAGAIANRQLQVFGDGMPRVRELAFARAAHCTLTHDGLGELVHVPAGTIRELFDRAKDELGVEPDALRFHHRQFVPDLYCATEGRSWAFPRLAESIHPKELECTTCYHGARRVPMSLADHLNRKDVDRFGALKWSEIGLARADIVTATGGEREVHYVVGA